VLTIGSNTFAFVPGYIGTGPDSGNAGLAEVMLANGGSTVLNRPGRGEPSIHYAPNTQIPRPRSASFKRLATVGDAGAGGSPIIALSPAPQECAADVQHLDLYCISYSSPIVNVVHVDASSATMSLLGTYTSDATGSIGFSGGSATIVGITWDPIDQGLLIATPTGYELYSGARTTTPNVKVKTIATVNPAENFGYNSLTDQIWSPTYLGGPVNANLIDVRTGALNALATLPSGYNEPDHGAIDSSTNLAVAAEEFSYTLYLVPLGQNTLGSPAAGQFTNPSVVTATMTTQQDNGCCPVSDISVDSASHLLFSTVEFGSGIGVVQLPSSSSGTPALGDYVFAALPNTPSGSYVSLPGDPHAVGTFNIGSTGPFGVSFDSAYRTVIITDMRALLAAPRNSGDPHGTTATLGKNVYYIQI
jgi:hypothetical protein